MIQLDGIGKEIIDKESNGTLGPPIQMSFLGRHKCATYDEIING